MFLGIAWPMRFVATLCSRVPTSKTGYLFPKGTSRADCVVVIEAPSRDDARRYARTLDPHSVTVAATPLDAEVAYVELRWRGERLQHRSREPWFSTRDAATGWIDL